MKKVDDFLPFLLLEKGENIIYNRLNKRAIISEVGERVGYFDDKFIRCDFELATGDVIEYQNIKWLVTSEINKDFKSYRARIRKTNYTINIVANNKVNVLDCIISNYKNNIEVIVNIINVVDDVITFTVPESSISNAIKVQFRFIKFGRAWEIIGKDYTQKGLVTFTANTTAIDPNTDDVVNEIANVDKLVDQSVIDARDLATITSLASTVTFTQTELSENLVIPSLTGEGVTVTWTSNNPIYLSNTGIVTRPLETESNQSAILTLTLQKGTQIITKTFTFTILADAPPVPAFEIQIAGKDVGYMSKTSYVAKVLNNNIEAVGETVTFALENIIMANVRINSQDGLSCVVESTSWNNGTFDLVAKLDSDNSIVAVRKSKVI